MMTFARIGILSTVLAAAWTVPAFTQSANRSQPTVTQPARLSGAPTTTATMGGMVQQCRDHCRTVTAQMDGLNRAVAEARRSNDPAVLRNALDAAEKASTEVQTQVNQCMRMMTTS
jgi:hypothetical protein